MGLRYFTMTARLPDLDKTVSGCRNGFIQLSDNQVESKLHLHRTLLNGVWGFCYGRVKGWKNKPINLTF